MNEANPYQAPTAALEKQVVPAGFTADKLDAREFERAGWLSLAYLVMVIVDFALLVLAEDSRGLVSDLLICIMTLTYLRLLLALKTLVRQRFEFHRLDGHSIKRTKL